MAKQINTILSLKDKMSQPLVKISDNVKSVTKEMRSSANQVNKWKDSSVKAIDNVVKKTVKFAAVAGAAFTGFAVKTAIDLEDSFSNVRKTVDATEEQLSQLRGELNNLAANEIPLAVDGLYEIASMAGQLGIKTENIVGFSDVMAKLAVATNMTSEQAATDLARLANITQMPQSEFDRLGSTIVKLGNNLATTESEIVNMSLRLAGAGKQVGMTEANILSFAGALSSVGIEAEAGGSAFSKVMVNMQLAVETGNKSLKDFAKVSGMSTKEFQKAFKNDAAGAITSFIAGLGKAEEQGISAIKMLDDMGIKEVRMRDALLRAAGAGNVFADSLAMGSEAWEENIALQEEADEKFKTTAAQLQFLKNNITLAADKLGQVFLPYINDAIKNGLIPFTQNLRDNTDRIKEVVDQVVTWATNIASFIKKHEKLITTVGVFVLGMYAAIKVIALAKAAMIGLNAIGLLLNGTLAMTPLGWLVIGIGLVIAAGYALWRNWDLIKQKASDLSYGVQAVFSNLGTATKNIFKGIGNFFITHVINPIINGLNSLGFTIPDWVPKFGGKTFGFNLKTVNTFDYGGFKSLSRPNANSVADFRSVDTAYAKGTSYSKSGYARIHEEGGEIRKLSSGETIIPADKSEKLLRNKSIGESIKVYVKILGNVIGNKQFIDQVGEEVATRVQLALANM